MQPQQGLTLWMYIAPKFLCRSPHMILLGHYIKLNEHRSFVRTHAEASVFILWWISSWHWQILSFIVSVFCHVIDRSGLFGLPYWRPAAERFMVLNFEHQNSINLVQCRNKSVTNCKFWQIYVWQSSSNEYWGNKLVYKAVKDYLNSFILLPKIHIVPYPWFRGPHV